MVRTEDDVGMGRRERVWAMVVVVVMVLAVALPGVRTLLEHDAADGFPLSTYPMFVSDRGRVVQQATVVAVGPDVTEPLAPDDPVERLSPTQIANTDQVVRAATTVRAMVRAGSASARELCEEVAERVPAPATLVVVTEKFDSISWAADNSVDPLERTEHAHCEATG